jgi:hypothetical protein
VLLVSELVTSVVVETEAAPSVSLTLDDGRVVVEVGDPHGAVARVLRSGSEPDERWSLRLVEELADAWGVRRRSDGTSSVWFSLADAA